jgi:L-asparaginase / beta-aspartyl-peptidase
MPDLLKPLDYSLAIHGGAGLNLRRLTAETRRQMTASLTNIGKHGQRLLSEGATSLETVEQVVKLLEDDPLFNAGRGAVFNHDGHHELDASIMDGQTKQCGAVAGVRMVKNPIVLARLVMQQTSHVLLAGDGADAFAQEMKSRHGLELVENEYFSTTARYEELQRVLQREATDAVKGTVGCVALDRHGNLAAATSTGGMTNKKFGRVGDSPIIGAGTYADNATAAVSCTGTGEFFIRHSVAFHVCALMMYKHAALDEAVKILLEQILPDDVGGIIAVDRKGLVTMQTNTEAMPRVTANSAGQFEVSIER